MQDAGTQTITLAMITDAMKLSGIELTEDERKAMVDSANQNLKRYEELRAIHIPNDVSPPFHFSPIVPGMTVNKKALPFVLSARAGGEAAGEPRRRRVLAGPPSRRAGAHAAGDLARADRDVSRAAASLQRRC